MAANVIITLVVDAPGFENRFGRAENVLDRPERLVNVSYRLGVVRCVSAQHPEPVVACLGSDLLFITRDWCDL
jgi:hypothetical protein